MLYLIFRESMAEKKNKGKYVLHTTSGTGGPKPCAFFALPEGCKNGSSCPFLHGDAPPTAPSSSSSSSSSHATTSVAAFPPPIKQEGSSSNMTKKDDRSSSTMTKKEKKAIRHLNKSPKTTSSISMGHSTTADIVNDDKQASTQLFSSSTLITSLGLPVTGYDEQASTSSNLLSPMVATTATSKKRPPSTPSTSGSTKPAAKSKRVSSGEEAEDDHAFLFGVVDHATKLGTNANIDSPFLYKADNLHYDRKHSIQSAKQGGEERNSMNPAQQVSTDTTNGMFLDPLETRKRLRTSGTKAAKNLENRSGSENSLLKRNEVDKSMHQTPVPANLLKADWNTLVVKTQSNPRFQEEFNFQIDSTWITAKMAAEWSVNLPRVIAIDCEMCVT